VIAFLALASTTNTTLLVFTAASRLMYGMARNGALPRTLATVGPRGRAPWVAALAAFAVATPFALSGRIELVAEVTNFAVYAIFLVVNLAVIQLRRRMPEAPRTFLAPGRIARLPLTPLLAIASVLLMLAYLRPEAWVFGAVMVASGVCAWFLGGRLGRVAV
jgi:APA family basic amino acid/polyamine antiporter